MGLNVREDSMLVELELKRKNELEMLACSPLEITWLSCSQFTVAVVATDGSG